MRGKSGTRAAFVARRSDETCERRDAGASNARRRWEKKTAPNAFCRVTKSCNWFSFRRHQLSVLVVKSSGLRTERRWERPGARAERCSAHLDPRVSAACVTSRCPPPLIENLCARIDDAGLRRGVGRDPARRPTAARSSRAVVSHFALSLGHPRGRTSRPSLWRGANRFQRGKTYRNDRHSTDSTHSTPLAEVVKEIGTELLGIRALRGLAQIHMTISL